jgi:CheY-like chemotaxis protein
VVSSPHQGSTFRVFLPSVDRDANDLRKHQEAVHLRAGTGTILVVDDDEFVRNISREALEQRGYDVVTAKDGKEAVELFEQRLDEIVLVILDMAMPVMSGEEAFRRLKALRPKVPILVSSGYSEVMASERFGSAVVRAFIQKPYTARDLAERVEGVLHPGA